MFENNNCSNCDINIDANNDKCMDAEYPLIDLSTVCLGKSLYLKLNLGTKDKPYIVTKKAIVTYTSVGQDASLMDLSMAPNKLMANLPNRYGFAFTECR